MADDWLLPLNQSVQIGTTKVCVIVGLRQSELPYLRRALCLEDLHLIGVHPLSRSTGELIAEQLEAAAGRVGFSWGITSDHGRDVKRGCELFAAAHPQTRLTYDTAHHGATLLKQRLESHPLWSSFLTRLVQVRARLRQTVDAFWMSPSVRAKARYMNLVAVWKGCRGILRLISANSPLTATALRARERYGWLEDSRAAVSAGSRWDATIHTCVSFVPSRGLSSGCGVAVAAASVLTSRARTSCGLGDGISPHRETAQRGSHRVRATGGQHRGIGVAVWKMTDACASGIAKRHHEPGLNTIAQVGTLLSPLLRLRDRHRGVCRDSRSMGFLPVRFLEESRAGSPCYEGIRTDT